MGAGRTEIVSTIFGDRRADSGEVFIYGNKAKIKKPSEGIKRNWLL